MSRITGVRQRGTVMLRLSSTDSSEIPRILNQKSKPSVGFEFGFPSAPSKSPAWHQQKTAQRQDLPDA